MNKSGFTIPEMAVAIAIISIATWGLMSMFNSHKRATSHFDRLVSANQVLTLTGAALQSRDFDYLDKLCVGSNAYNVPHVGSCVVSQTLNSNPTPTDSAKTPSTLEIRRDWTGETDKDGLVCVELSRCRRRAADRILELELRAFWFAPPSQLVSKVMTIRRTRW